MMSSQNGGRNGSGYVRLVGARNNCQVADESLLKVASDLTLQRQWIRRRYNGWGYDGVSVGGGRYEAIVPDVR